MKKEAYAENFMQKFDLEPIKVEIDPYFTPIFVWEMTGHYP